MTRQTSTKHILTLSNTETVAGTDLQDSAFLNKMRKLVLLGSFGLFALTSVVQNATAEVISPTESIELLEPEGTYDTAEPTLLNMYVRTVIETGPCVAGDYAGCTLTDVLNDINPYDDFKPEIKVHFSADDFPDDGQISNAEFRQRGATSRSAPQKSFRIKLDSKNDLWRGERRIQLVKSFWDFTRIRNKLNYDLFTEIPHLPSMRTQFVKLFVEDQGVTEDYGLYTQVEYFGKEYLVRRNWDKDSGVYKAENFYFKDDPAFALDEDGEPLDIDAFEQIIEIKRGDDHSKFVEMIQALNNPALDFQTQVFDKYYNRDNYLTWLAINILMGNWDTNFHNYYLYNPLGSDRFYFVPWDYDLSLDALFDTGILTIDVLARWQLSHANWWGQELHQQFLRQPGNLALLRDAVLEIKNAYLTEEQIQAKATSYYDIVFSQISVSPDFDYLWLPGNTDPEVLAFYNSIFNDLAKQVETNYQRFIEHYGDPMPFSLYAPQQQEDGNIRIDWSESESLLGQTIHYDLEISTSLGFEAGNIVQTVTGLSNSEHTLLWTHPAGDYYYRVIARDTADPANSWQIAYNQVSEDVTRYGVYKFYASEGVTPVDGISNLVNDGAISIDGTATDWAGLAAFDNDPDDIVNSDKEVIDWLNATIAHDSQSFYLLYRNRGPVNPDNADGSYIPWGWQVFIDTDKNPTTGFRISDSLGADYLIEGTRLRRYSGNGDDWSWQSLATADLRYSGDTAELRLPRELIESPSSAHFLFQGVNNAYDGKTIDYYPNGAFNSQAENRYWSYTFGTFPNTGNRAPVAYNQSLSLLNGTSTQITLNTVDPENDNLTLSVVSQPDNGVLSFTGNELVVTYTPDAGFIGTDEFSYRVNDGTQDSNIATVSLNVIEDNADDVVSNPVIANGISVDGKDSDWDKLELYGDDPDDVDGGDSNVIDWKKAGIAHSSDTVYLFYENRNDINKDDDEGSFLAWGWQTYLDTDRNAASGYRINATTGADYLVEGGKIFRYNGTGNNWDWVKIGSGTVRYKKKKAELSFPRSLLGAHSTVHVLFFGNNSAFGGSTSDAFPDTGHFSYYFGTGLFEKVTQVADLQKGVYASPSSHQPSVSPTDNGGQTASGGGGSMGWFVLLTLALLRRFRT